MGSKKTKTELIAQNEAMRHRLETLEKRPGKERRSNYLLRIFIDALSNFGFSVDADGRILHVLTGGQVSEARVLEGRFLADILPNTDAEELGSALRKTFETGEAWDFEFIISVMARRRWYWVKTALVPDQNGEEKIAVFLFGDVTNEKLAEGVLEYAQLELRENLATLRKSDQTLRNFLDFANDSIFIIDAQTLRFLDFNENAANRLGFSRKELLQKTVDEINAPGSVLRIKKNIHQLLQTDGSVFERTHYCKDGTEIPVEISARIIEYNGEKVLISFVRDITKRKRDEEALQQSEAKYRDSVETWQDLVWQLDREGRFIYLNQAWESILGYSLEETIGYDFRDFKLPEDRNKGVQRHKQTMQEVQAASFETTYTSKTGDEVILNIKTKPLLDPTGQIVGTQGTATDITERKQAEEALRESENNFRNLVEGSIQGICIHENGIPRFANQAYPRIFGYDSFEDISKVGELNKLFVEDEQERLLGYRAARLRGDPVPVDYEVRATKKDGSEIWVYTYNHLVEWKGIPMIQQTVIDITERKRAEEALRESETKFRDLVETSQDLIFRQDQEGRFTYLNPAWETTLGYSLKEMAGQPFSNFKLPEEAERTSHTLRHILQGGSISNAETTYISKTGKEVILTFKAKPVVNASGHIVGVQGTATDITERKQAEEQFRGLAEGSIQGILVYRNFKPLFANQAMVDLMGYDSVQEILSLDLEEMPFHPPHERERVRNMAKARMRQENPYNRYEAQGIKKDGSLFSLEALVTTVYWEGEPTIQVAYTDITERKQAEEALRESREAEKQALARLNDAVESLPGSFAIYDEEDRFVFGNSKTTEMFPDHAAILKPGTTYEEVIRRTLEKGLILGDPGEQKAHIQKRLREHGEQPDIIEQQWADGRWFAVYHRPTSTGGTVSIRLDITARKQAEEALRESRENYKRLFDTMLDGYATHEIICDDEGKPVDYKFQEINNAFQELTGLGNDIVGKTVLEVIPNLEHYWIETYGKVALTGESVRLENYAQGVGEKWFDVVAYSAVDRQFTTVFREITARKEAEEALRESEKRTRDFIESVPAFLGYIDKDLHYQQINLPSQRFYGHTEKEFIGKSLLEVVGSESYEQVLPFVQEVLEGREVTFDIRRSVRDLGLRDLNVHWVPDKDEKGEVIGFYFCTQDQTESKQLEAQFQQAQKMEAVGTLAGGIAHNFNNLLQMIMSNISLLLMETGSNHPQHKILSAIENRVESGAELTRQLLGFARGGKYEVCLS